MALTTNTDRPKIVFFDLETTGRDQDWVIIEFGAILLCPDTLVELHRYAEFVRPADPTRLHCFPDRGNGITRDAIDSAQTFAEIADEIYELLHGRIWAGHNIRDWDGPQIEKAFREIHRLAPEPKGIIDSLELLSPGFARRVGSMKLANLARHFKIDEPKHRSLDDVLKNLDVLKFCSTVLFLESSLPDLFPDWVSPDEIALENDNNSVPPSISVTLAHPFYQGPPKILLLHKNLPLKLFCENLTICYGIDAISDDHRGRPRLNFVVYVSDQRLCRILEICNSLAEKLSAGCGSNSEWQNVVKMNGGSNDFPTVRLNLPFVEGNDFPCLATKIYLGERPIEISTFDARELDHLLIQGNHVDAYFSLNTYDYRQNAGIRLVADKVIVHT